MPERKVPVIAHTRSMPKRRKKKYGPDYSGHWANKS